MKKNKNKNKGFTLIELLSIILILGLVITIVIYFSIEVVNKANEKTYAVTVNNIQNVVSHYLSENNDRLFFVNKIDDDNFEYQCVTVGDLVENGYLKNDVYNSKVSKERYVLENDYVYIEKDKNTKAVSKIKYLIDNNVGMCDKSIDATSTVSISVAPSDWSAYKDITVIYKLKNYFNIDDYIFYYEYDKNNVLSVISDNGAEKKLRVTDNGIIKAYVKSKKDGSILQFGNEKEINKIDKIPPVIKTTDIVKIYSTKFDLCEGLTITDNSGKSTVCRSYYNGVEFTDSSKLPVGDNVLYYEAEDLFGNISERVSRTIKIVVPDKEFNYLEKDQIYPVEADGTYIIEAYGAQGGNSGGKGGYVKAEVELKSGDKLIINTGGFNGYNGGGGYNNKNYVSGGGATTVRYNNNYIVIAGGGGAKGSSGTAGSGGTGNGKGGADVGAGAGISGSNGGGGSNSLNYKYDCNCKTCGGECTKSQVTCDTCHGQSCHWECDKYGSGPDGNENCLGGAYECSSYPYDCNCRDECVKRAPTYSCNCQTCTKNGKSGNGGANVIKSPAVSIENVSGKHSDNGYVKVSYKLEG